MNAITPIVERYVDNPLLDSAERMEQWARELASAERQCRVPSPDNIKVKRESNEVTRMGALAFIREREDYHEKAAVRFKNEYEALYGDVTPAVDPANVPVDTSTRHTSATDNMVRRIERSESIKGAMAILDKDELNLILACVCMGIPSSELVSKMPGGKPNSRQVQHRNRRILHLLKKLSIWWGYILAKDAA